jgi:hypothetical protein
VARLDRRKRPTLYFDLARRFPHVRFIAMGKARDPQWGAYLQKTYGDVPNLEMIGLVDQFSSERHSQILSESWVMVNTATREALPNAFLEAAAHQCAILSGVDPDGFASRFGHHARDEDFAKGLAALLDGDAWRARGLQGYEYVRDTFELNHAVDLHEEVYRQLPPAPRTIRA